MSRREPVFLAASLVTLGLGLGANLALFAFTDTLILRSLPIPDPARLVRIGDEGGDRLQFRSFESLQREANLFDGVAASATIQSLLLRSEDGASRPATIAPVSGGYFQVLGVPAKVGRAFTSQSGHRLEARVAVLSHDFWQERFGASTAVIGGELFLDDRRFTIVGVAGEDFRGTLLEAPIDVWVPVEQWEGKDSQLWARGRWLTVWGRMRQGATLSDVQIQASNVLGRPAVVTSGHNGESALRSRFGRSLVLVQMLASAVFLMACVNMAAMALARAAARQREAAVRRALGASSRHVVVQNLAETLMVCVGGSGAGFAIGFWLRQVLVTFVPRQAGDAMMGLPVTLERIMLAGAVGCVGAWLITSAPAAIWARRMRDDELLSQRFETTTRRGARFRRVLVVFQVAVATVLVIMSGLFVGSLRNLLSIPIGAVPNGVGTARIDLRNVQQASDRFGLYERLRRQSAVLPGVRQVGYSRIGQLTGGGVELAIFTELPTDRARQKNGAYEQRISPGFLEAMGTRVVAGRHFNDGDSQEALPVALVNEAFARHFFPAIPALGQRFRAEPSGANLAIVGLVEDSKWVDLRENPRPMFYRPASQVLPPSAVLAFSTNGDISGVARLIADLAQRIDGRLSITDVTPFAEVVKRSTESQRLVAALSAGFGALGIVVACGGLYSLVAFTCARRTREFAIRMAIGARRSEVVTLLARDLVPLVTVGLVVGAAAAVGAARFAESLLFGITSLDGRTYLLAIGMLAVGFLLTCSRVVLRSARTSLAATLKAE